MSWSFRILTVGLIASLCTLTACGDGETTGTNPNNTANNGGNNNGNNGGNNGNNANNGGNNGNNTNNGGNNGNNANNGTSLSCEDDPLCQIDSSGSGTPFDLDDADAQDEGVSLDADGNVTLEVDAVTPDEKIIWIANTPDGTVSKVDTTTYLELARYFTGAEGRGNDPSRTSVNGFGDVYIGNRGGGSISKIYGDCPDQNNDGMIQTSTGAADVKPWGEDECQAWTTELCEGCLIRAVAAQDIGPNNEVKPVVWVGGFRNSTIWKLDGQTGQVLLTTTSPVRPYGFAIDKTGNLWVSGPNFGYGSESTGFGRIDTNRCVDDASCNVEVCMGEGPTEDACIKQRIGLTYQPYGITVDFNQNVWLGGTNIALYEPSKPAGSRLNVTNSPGFIHGISADDKGFVYGAIQGTGTLQIDASNPASHQFIAGGGSTAKGMAIDKDGKVWSVNRSGDATVFQPGATLADTTVVSTVSGFTAPYTYSDMTGQQLSLASDAIGFYRRVYKECPVDEYLSTTWKDLTWEAEVPVDSEMTIRIRYANTRAALAAAEWTEIAKLPGADVSPFDVGALLQSKGVASPAFIEVDILMVSKRSPGVAPTPPVLKGLSLSKECPPIVN